MSLHPIDLAIIVVYLAAVTLPIDFRPFEIKTLRIEKDGCSGEVRMIEEEPL